MLHLKRTDSTDPDFIQLVARLDAELKISDGDEHDFYNQYNGIDMIRYAVVAYLNGQAVGCGAIKAFDAEAMEVKRMYVNPNCRGQKIATTVLKDLEQWARELGYQRCVLETGKKQPEAIALYHYAGYQIIANYGQYIGVDNSVCFEKKV